jgi:hypothetical protein
MTPRVGRIGVLLVAGSLAGCRDVSLTAALEQQMRARALASDRAVRAQGVETLSPPIPSRSTTTAPASPVLGSTLMRQGHQRSANR